MILSSLRAKDGHGLLPEAEGPTLEDEEEALRSLGEDPKYWDDVSGAVLPPEAVRAARAEEVAFMEGWDCWSRVSYEEAHRCGGQIYPWSACESSLHASRNYG